MANAEQIFTDNFLTLRAKLIEVAAVLDRVDRAEEDASESIDASTAEQREKIEQAIRTLVRGAVAPGERAATLQQLFSRPYEPDWRSKFQL